MLAFMPFSFSVTGSNTRIGVILTLMLSSINFKISVTTRIPTVSYFTVLDKYAIPALIYLIILCIYHAIIGSSLFSSLSVTKLNFIDKIVFYSVAGVYFTLSVIYLIYFISKIFKQKRIEKEFQQQSQKPFNSFPKAHKF